MWNGQHHIWKFNIFFILSTVLMGIPQVYLAPTLNNKLSHDVSSSYSKVYIRWLSRITEIYENFSFFGTFHFLLFHGGNILATTETLFKAEDNEWSLGNFEVSHQKPDGIQILSKYYFFVPSLFIQIQSFWWVMKLLIFTGRHRFLNIFVSVLIQFTHQKGILHGFSRLAMKSGTKFLL